MPKSGDDGAAAGGIRSAATALRRASRDMGIGRGLKTLARVNQTRGFDCPGCAWPDPVNRARIEFCENGAKAVAHEATRARIERSFFERHPVSELLGRSNLWLEQQGRLSEPMWKPPGADHYQPVSWDDALARIATTLRELAESSTMSMQETHQALHQLMDQKLVRLDGDELVAPDPAALTTAVARLAPAG